MRNRPKTNTVYNLPPNSPILVQREGNTGQAKHWDGLYNLLTVKREIYIVKLLSGPISFQYIVVKLYLQSKSLKSNLEINLKP